MSLRSASGGRPARDSVCLGMANGVTFAKMISPCHRAGSCGYFFYAFSASSGWRPTELNARTRS
jgi:hypothetical protein